MSPGLALLVGILIGAAVVYFLMQARLQARAAVSQDSQDRADNLSETYTQDIEQRLAEQRSQIETEYEQRIATKIEAYQDEHSQQLADLEAEYEARLAALSGTDAAPSTAASTPVVASEPAPPASSARPLDPPPVGAAATVLGVSAGATVLPDPWDEAPVKPPTITPPPEITSDTEPESTPVDTTTAPSAPPIPDPETRPSPASPSQDVSEPQTESPVRLGTTLTAAAAQLEAPLPEFRRSAAQTLGDAAATSRKDVALALPMLGKLTKDPDPTVRVAAVEALRQCGSAKAIPLLKQSLRDPDGDVVAAASEALNRFKGTPKTKPQTQKTKKKRPKNR